jgi:hypothetical protein
VKFIVPGVVVTTRVVGGIVGCALVISAAAAGYGVAEHSRCGISGVLLPMRSNFGL